jgi:sulfite exporter TauE/SafE
METVVLTAFLLGLTSNLHCIGMCGPIAMAIPVNRTSTLSILKGIFEYNIGRITTYGTLGLIVGMVGLTINTLGILQWISIISGVLLIVYAWRKWITIRLGNNFPQLGIQAFVSRNIGKIITSKSPFKLLLLGMLNGLLPCGMVYLALMNAILAGAPDLSSIAMIVFGVATLPAMLLVGYSANKINAAWRLKLNRTVPYLLTLVGLLIIVRGLNLGIPYLSPKVTVAKEYKNVPQKVEMSCCHKPH